MENSGHQLRCTGCARVIEQRELKGNFRCAECGDLYEVVYPSWSVGSTSEIRKPNASAMRWLWKERCCSNTEADQSGVWRFREMLHILRDESNIVSLREGNTPLYQLRSEEHTSELQSQ